MTDCGCPGRVKGERHVVDEGAREHLRTVDRDANGDLLQCATTRQLWTLERADRNGPVTLTPISLTDARDRFGPLEAVSSRREQLISLAAAETFVVAIVVFLWQPVVVLLESGFPMSFERPWVCRRACPEPLLDLGAFGEAAFLTAWILSPLVAVLAVLWRRRALDHRVPWSAPAVTLSAVYATATLALPGLDLYEGPEGGLGWLQFVPLYVLIAAGVAGLRVAAGRMPCLVRGRVVASAGAAGEQSPEVSA